MDLKGQYRDQDDVPGVVMPFNRSRSAFRGSEQQVDGYDRFWISVYGSDYICELSPLASDRYTVYSIYIYMYSC